MSRLGRYLLLPWGLLSLLMLVAVASVTVALTVVPSLRWVAAVPLLELLGWVLLQLPGVVVQVLPLSLLLVSALIVGGHHESGTFRAVAAGGVAPWQVLWPWAMVLLLGSGCSLGLSEYLQPFAEQRASVLWWSITDDRSPAYRLQGRDLILPDGVVWRFDGYQAGSDTLLALRVVRSQAQVVEIWRAPEASWQDTQLILEGASSIRLDLDALDRVGLAGVTWADYPQPLQLTLPEARRETQARYSLGSVGDGRSWSRHRQLAQDPFASLAERSASQRRAAEMLVASLGVTLLGGVALLLMVRWGRSRPLLLLAAGVMGVGWLALSAVGYSFSLSGALPAGWGPWLPVLVTLLLGAGALRGSRLW